MPILGGAICLLWTIGMWVPRDEGGGPNRPPHI